MLRSVRRAGAVAGLLALAAVTALGGAATAAPSGSKSPSQAMADAAKGSGGSGRLKVVAKGLDNPRGIGIGPDGALYVAESGSGGAGPCVAGPEGADVCFGRTSGGSSAACPRSPRRAAWPPPARSTSGSPAGPATC
jgi:glucose/arabinose dehydrogenase